MNWLAYSFIALVAALIALGFAIYNGWISLAWLLGVTI